MNQTEILGELKPRAEEFVCALYPDARMLPRGDQRFAVLEDGSEIAVSGIRAGMWRDGLGYDHDLIGLACQAKRMKQDEALEWIEAWLRGSNGNGKHVTATAPIAVTTNSVETSSSLVVVPPKPHFERKLTYTPDLHRLLPQSPDAEMGVLGGLLHMGAIDHVMRLCKEKGLTAAQFHVPAHALIYALIDEMWHEGDTAVDFITVTTKLDERGQLAAVGGPAFVTGLFTFLPTAANVANYIDIVQEKWAARQFVQTCTEGAARGYDVAENLDELVTEHRAKMQSIADSRQSASMASLLDAREFDLTKQLAEPPPIWKLGDSTIATPGNIMAVQAKAKAGKTAALGAMMAAAMGGHGDCFTFTADNRNGLAVLHFDTEQSPYDHQQFIWRVLRRAGLTEPPPWFHSYCITDLPLRTRRTLITMELERRHAQHGGVFAAILDGLGDLCMDPNDPAEAFELVDEMHRLAIKHNTCIVNVLHENPGSEIGKTRGHLGSQLERKAETNLRLEKNAEGITVIFAERARSAHIPKERGVKFAWNDEAKMHVTTEAVFAKKEGGKRSNSRELAAKTKLGRFFAHGKIQRWSLMKVACGIPTKTFEDYWKELIEKELIVRNPAVKSAWEASAAWLKELDDIYDDAD